MKWADENEPRKYVRKDWPLDDLHSQWRQLMGCVWSGSWLLIIAFFVIMGLIIRLSR